MGEGIPIKFHIWFGVIDNHYAARVANYLKQTKADPGLVHGAMDDGAIP